MLFRRSCLAVVVVASAVVGRAGCSHDVLPRVDSLRTMRMPGGVVVAVPLHRRHALRDVRLTPLPDVHGALAALALFTAYVTPTTTTSTTTTQPVARARTIYPASYQPCDGEYPPCWRVQTESRGDYGAFNPSGCYSQGRSGCYGKWQFGWFWAGKLGLPADLSVATPAEQDEAARILWDHGRGCSNWSAC